MVTVPLVVRSVKVPAAAEFAPIIVPSIAPPVIVALEEWKLLAVTTPAIETVSSDEPMLIVSATVLSVPMLIRFAEESVPILIDPFVVAPVPALIVTEPPVEPAKLVEPAIKFKAPPVAAAVLEAGLTVIFVPPERVVISAVLFPAR
jgi:hypothetical protein